MRAILYANLDSAMVHLELFGAKPGTAANVVQSVMYEANVGPFTTPITSPILGGDDGYCCHVDTELWGKAYVPQFRAFMKSVKGSLMLAGFDVTYSEQGTDLV